MAENSTEEIICAFAAGCMDNNNFVHLKEYIRENKDLPYEDLGELQNIMAMVPIILEIEAPNPEIKKRVAKELITVTEEIKEKKRAMKKLSTGEDKPPREEKVTKRTTRVTLAENKRAEDDLLIKKNLNNEELFDPKKTQKLSDSVPKKVERQTEPKQKRTFIPYILFGIVVIALITASYFFQKTNDELEFQLRELRADLESVQRDFNASQRFINNYMSLIEFFHYNDISVINLENSDSSGASGKLFVSFEEREALIQVNNMPTLTPDKVFEIWLVSKGVSMSMGVFVPKLNQTYIKVPSFPSVPKEEIDLFRVTIEPTAGANAPSGSLVMFGSLVKEKPPEPVRRRRW